MKRSHLWLTAIVAMAIICLVGCKKDKHPKVRPVSTVVPVSPTVPDSSVIPVPPVSNLSKKYLPFKIKGNDYLTIYSYDDHTNILRSIAKYYSNSDSVYALFYDRGRPLYMNFVVDDYLISHTKYTVNARGEVVRGDVFNVLTDGWDWTPTTLKNYYTLTYDTLSQLTQVSYFQLNGNKESDAFFNYSSEGNIREVRSSGNINLEYDNFNGMSKSLKYLHLFYIEGGDHLLFFNKNNPTKLNETSRSYKYNDDKYPVEMSITSSGGVSVYSIEYVLK